MHPKRERNRKKLQMQYIDANINNISYTQTQNPPHTILIVEEAFKVCVDQNQIIFCLPKNFFCLNFKLNTKMTTWMVQCFYTLSWWQKWFWWDDGERRRNKSEEYQKNKVKVKTPAVTLFVYLSVSISFRFFFRFKLRKNVLWGV